MADDPWANFAPHQGGQKATDDAWSGFAPYNSNPDITRSPSGVPRITVRPEGPPPNGATFESRFDALSQGDQAPAMQQMATGFLNQGSAAGQRTTPDIAAHAPNLISADTFESDEVVPTAFEYGERRGRLQYRDPATGQVHDTDQKKHIALRDPADGKVKVYARTEGTDEGALSATGRLLGTGSAAGAVTRRPAIPTPTTAEATPRASEIFATSKAPYRAFKAEAEGIDIPAETASGLADRLRGSLTKANFIPELAQPVYSAVAILDKGEPLTVDALQNIKRVVGRGFNSPDKNVRDAAAVASREIGKILSEVAPSAAKNLRTADDIHSTALAVQDLQRKSDVAGLRAGRAGYGGNAPNTMRQVLSPIVQKSIEGRSTLYKPNEIAAMREIVEGSTATNVARQVGAMSPSKGSIPIAGAGGAAYALGPAAIAIPVLGAAGNKLASVLTGKQIDRLKELVAKRSPAYAEAVSKAVQRYENAQMELINNPSSGTLAKYVSTSRQLANGLNRDGLAVTSGDLMKAISKAPGRADEDEPEPDRVVGQ